MILGTLTDNGLAFGTLPGGYNYALQIDAIQTKVNLVVSAPEPAAAGLLGLGALLLAARRRRGEAP